MPMPTQQTRPRDTRTLILPHPPQPIPYECIYDYVTKTTARHPDTIFSHTLPSRFASRCKRLAHPSHALASPPSAAYEARATGIGV